MMRMMELAGYGIPQAVVDLWEARESAGLLPLQEMAVKNYNLFGDKNLLLQAPTSSGKTFIGEMAAIQTALRRKKVAYLVPLKALAEEKFLDFREKYAPYGVEVIISTRDRREFDARLENGQFSIAVVVYEKLAQLLVRRPERVAELELIIADELELLSDPDRGALVETLLTRALEARCRIIGLSAVIGGADKLAAWMGAALLAYDRRPVELRHGVLHEGVFRYRTYNEFGEGEEALVPLHSESPWEIVAENLREFVARGEPCLVFVKAKHESRLGAQSLARRVELPAAAETIESLRRLEATHSRDALLETLERGVAFHNADLSPAERRAVEAGFRAGEVLALVSTSTLATGMNLPAQNVFIAADKWRYDRRYGMPWKTPILRAEYENMGGRAGRYGAGTPFGRSILVAATPFDQETLWRRYVDGPREDVEPQLAQAPLDDHIVRLVASRSCSSEEALLAFFERTLTGHWIWAETLSREEKAYRVQSAAGRAAEQGLLRRSAEGRLEATPFGLAVAAKGVTAETARDLAHWLRVSEKRDWSPLDLMLAAALTADGRMLQVTLTAREYSAAAYPAQLKARALGDELEADTPLNRLRTSGSAPFFEEVRAIKVALMLEAWIDHAPIYAIEEEFQTLGGQILGAAEQIGWLLDATAAIAQAFSAQDTLTGRIAVLAERVSKGLREKALPLARLGLEGLTRNALMDLAAQGFCFPEKLRETSAEALAAWVDLDTAKALKTWAEREARGNAGTPEPALPPDTVVLVVDDRAPGQIVVDGISVTLQDKQYRLIRALAEFPGECVPYERIYAAVWGATVVEDNQMHFQKRKLLAAIKKAAPARADVIKTIPKHGFTLALTPKQVAIKACAVSSAA